MNIQTNSCQVLQKNVGNGRTQKEDQVQQQVVYFAQRQHQAILNFTHQLQRLQIQQQWMAQAKGFHQQNIYPIVIQLNSPNQYLVHTGNADPRIPIKNLPLLAQTHQMCEQSTQNFRQFQIYVEPQQEPVPEVKQIKMEYIAQSTTRPADSASGKNNEIQEEGNQKKSKRGRKKTSFLMPDQYQNVEKLINDIIQLPQSEYLDSNRVIKKRIRKNKHQKKLSLIQGNELKETKNIPKNFVKAAITYVLQNPNIVDKLIKDHEQAERFLVYLAKQKMTISNIKQLCAMLTANIDPGEQADFNRAFRQLFGTFIKRNGVAYIFNSRITQVNWHLIYRYNLLRAIRCPEKFKKMKDI